MAPQGRGGRAAGGFPAFLVFAPRPTRKNQKRRDDAWGIADGPGGVVGFAGHVHRFGRYPAGSGGFLSVLSRRQQPGGRWLDWGEPPKEDNSAQAY